MSFKKFYFKENEGETNDDGVVVHKYSSVQANLPEEVAVKVLEFGKTIPDNDIYEDKNDPSYGREKTVYTTILYGIHSEQPDEVRNLVVNVQPFNIELGEISFFEGDKNYDVMKIDVKSYTSVFQEQHDDYLCKVNKYLTAHLDYTNKWPTYIPHITICYLKSSSRAEIEKNLNKEALKGLKCQIKELIFSSSNGIKTVLPILY